jgi:hypothetical protein
MSEPGRACGRAPKCGTDYQARLSGPLLDRIDIHVEVAAVTAQDLALPPPAEGSAVAAKRVAQARDIQRARYEGLGLRTNAEVEGELLDRVAQPDAAGQRLLVDAAEKMRLTARGYHRGPRRSRHGRARACGRGDFVSAGGGVDVKPQRVALVCGLGESESKYMGQFISRPHIIHAFTLDKSPLRSLCSPLYKRLESYAKGALSLAHPSR